MAESGDRDRRRIACAPVLLEASRLQPGVLKEYGVLRVRYSAQVGVRGRRLEADEARENLVRLRGDLRGRSDQIALMGAPLWRTCAVPCEWVRAARMSAHVRMVLAAEMPGSPVPVQCGGVSPVPVQTWQR